MNNISFEKVVTPPDSSFCAINYSNPYFAAPLHIHPEYELILIEEGEGLSFVGDLVHKLVPGNFMLIGKNLPHLWLSADAYYEKQTPLISRSVYSQFDSDILPKDFFLLPEFKDIQILLKESQKGLLFKGGNKEKVADRFRKLPDQQGFIKLMELYFILYELATECEYTSLTSEQYESSIQIKEDDVVLKRAYDYMNQKYYENISLEDIAGYAGMNPSALCRYFKKRTNKTLFGYLSELRISYAVKLLTNKGISISQVAYDCGYNNLSHFNKQFKAIIGKTPTEYCKLINS